MPRTVFVSYARKDSNRIQPAVALLEAGGAEVFRDIDDIEFGDDREAVITRKLQECERVMIFWSANAKASEWVGKEYTIALAQQKRLVPVLLDNTPLPPELSKYHALTNFMPQPPEWKKYGSWAAGAVALTVLVVSLQTFRSPEILPHTEPLVVESVDLPPIVDSNTVSDVNAKVIAKSAGSGESPDDPAGDPLAPDPVVIVPPIEEPSGPVFAWGAGLLSLLLLFLLWFRKRSDASLNNEYAAEQFVDLVFDEE